MNYSDELQRYLDEQGRVKQWPSKRNNGKFQRLVLEYLTTKFESGIIYTEKEVNLLLNEYHLFGDPALLRRELFEGGLINRKRDGSAYWSNQSVDNITIEN
ncbi:DUF2087 domain-containing protein [Cylindrospermum sp. FACHB-282]|uniref:DUF2087 domain-containing protein n=1 Tax=Cylindrospermum sp. FACHB-282 TaxID=2692794 RepID=UPI001684603A|nr:DUF2087 domain-containing protein [Cylindrospermum sp. FACHB-282]MBD2388797.1 DUF2087 domain-containing protein [Cylindrospermum sp. FACHB-282]